MFLMIIILTEKPSAARNFAKALGGMQGEFNGETYKIVSARGHLLEFKSPEMQVNEELQSRYKKWDIINLPWNWTDFNWYKDVKKGAKPILDNIKLELKKAEEVVIATDVDPSGEGELLAWEILNWCKWKGKVSRMYFTDEAAPSLCKAFKERKTLIGGAYKDGDFLKADTRSKWDFLSMQFTRAATCLAKEHGEDKLLRQGRLKSVMVSFVGKQLEDIKNFVKVPYFEVRFEDENGNRYAKKPEDAERFPDKTSVDIDKYRESEIEILSTVEKTKVPGRLLDLAGLSAILAEKGAKADKVLEIYQNMYEHQIVSYPRTEDKTITEEQFNELLPYIDKIAKVVGINPALLTYRNPCKTHVKSGGAHGANRPGTNVPENLEDIKRDYGELGAEIYKLLARNYLAMFGENYKYLQRTARVKDFPEFVGTINIPISLGFKEIYESSSNEEEENNKEVGTTGSPFIFEGSNKKPEAPSMKWLVKKLEKYNVGTGATRTSTFAEITQNNDKALLTVKKGKLDLTAAGELSYQITKDTNIASAEVTEKLFESMKAVGEFKADPKDIFNDLPSILKEDIKIMSANAQAISKKQVEPKKSQNADSLGTCPVCKEAVIKRTGKYGDFYCCAGSGCKFSISGVIAGKKISESMVKDLLKKGSTRKLTGFKKKAGGDFSATLILNKDKVEFRF